MNVPIDVSVKTGRNQAAVNTALTALVETIVGIPYNIDADLMTPSITTYRARRSGAWWVISDEHTRVIFGEQRRTQRSAIRGRSGHIDRVEVCT